MLASFLCVYIWITGLIFDLIMLIQYHPHPKWVSHREIMGRGWGETSHTARPEQKKYIYVLTESCGSWFICITWRIATSYNTATKAEPCYSGLSRQECWCGLPLQWTKFTTDAFELWCWRRLLRVPWTAQRSNQSVLKEINPEYSLEGLMLKLKLQYFGHLMRRADSLEKTLMLGKTDGRRWSGWQRMRWLDGSRRWLLPWRTGTPGVLQSMGSQRVSHDWATEHHHHNLGVKAF